MTIGVLAVSVGLVGAYVLTAPRSVEVRGSIVLSGDHSPPWEQRYCVPDGTLVTFYWHTSDGSEVTLSLWSNQRLQPLLYSYSGNSGAGTTTFDSSVYFSLAHAPSPPTLVLVDLYYSVLETYVPGPPSFGPC